MARYFGKQLFVFLSVLALVLVASAGPSAAAEAGKFKPVFDEWKETLAQLRHLQEQYNAADATKKKELEDQYATLITKGNELAPKLLTAAEEDYAAKPNEDKQITDFLVANVDQLMRKENFEEVMKRTKFLIDHDCTQAPVLTAACQAAYHTNDFAAAREYQKKAIKAGGSVTAITQLLEQIDATEKLWEDEKKIRDAEAKADDLPRVKIATSKGDIVVELFENEAPNTVANFISLVEKGYYNGIKFHRVIPGFMAQTGDPQGTGSGGPGYTIPDEVSGKYRHHFRGSLSMAKTAAPDSGGSQFFLCFVRTPHLDGQHTVFGRVIEGFDVLGKIQKVDPEHRNPGIPPDEMKTVTVVRKREHKYEPKTLPGK